MLILQRCIQTKKPQKLKTLYVGEINGMNMSDLYWYKPGSVYKSGPVSGPGVKAVCTDRGWGLLFQYFVICK